MKGRRGLDRTTGGELDQEHGQRDVTGHLVGVAGLDLIVLDPPGRAGALPLDPDAVMAGPGPENDAARQVAAETTVRRRHTLRTRPLPQHRRLITIPSGQVLALAELSRGLLHALVLGTLAALLGGDRHRKWFWAALVIATLNAWLPLVQHTDWP
jgi:hypothetical protein